jgi:hypothetical protein
LITNSGTFGSAGVLVVDPDNNNGLASNFLRAGTSNNGICNITNTTIGYQNANTGVGTTFAQLNAPNSSAVGTIALTNISSINGAQLVQAGRYNFASPGTNTVTLATPYNSASTFAVTANSTSATAPVAVATTSPSTFTLTYTGVGLIHWMTSGVTQ